MPIRKFFDEQHPTSSEPQWNVQFTIAHYNELLPTPPTGGLLAVDSTVYTFSKVTTNDMGSTASGAHLL